MPLKLVKEVRYDGSTEGITFSRKEYLSNLYADPAKRMDHLRAFARSYPKSATLSEEGERLSYIGDWLEVNDKRYREIVDIFFEEI